MSQLVTTLRLKMISDLTRPIMAPVNMLCSGTYIFPFYGIYYFVFHPSLWLFYLNILTPQLLLIFVIYLLSYVCLFPVQAFFAVIFSGPLGLVSTWLTVLQQASLISSIICAMFILPEVQKIVFDAVLTREFHNEVVLMGKLRRVVPTPNLVKIGYLLFSVPKMLNIPLIILRGLTFILISSIPVMGPLISTLIQAPSKGLHSQGRYFALKGFDTRQIQAIYMENKGQFMGFGLVANFLESIPILNIFFMFTNTIGAALWAVSIENKLRSQHVVAADIPNSG